MTAELMRQKARELLASKLRDLQKERQLTSQEASNSAATTAPQQRQRRPNSVSYPTSPVCRTASSSAERWNQTPSSPARPDEPRSAGNTLTLPASRGQTRLNNPGADYLTRQGSESGSFVSRNQPGFNAPHEDVPLQSDKKKRPKNREGKKRNDV